MLRLKELKNFISNKITDSRNTNNFSCTSQYVIIIDVYKHWQNFFSYKFDVQQNKMINYQCLTALLDKLYSLAIIAQVRYVDD